MSDHHQPETIREAYLQASSFLKNEAGEGQPPERVAQLLLEYATGHTYSELMLRWNEPIQDHSLALLQEGLRRKAAGEPIQYIIGEQEFYGYPFTVNPSVLIPRPETELLAEAVLKLAPQLFPDREAIIAADIGTGSGAIAVTLAKQSPRFRIWATDLSSEALQVAKTNAARHEVSRRLEFVQGDLLQPLLDRQLPIDVLVSNPPYIPTGELKGLQDEVKDYEPIQALDGGLDGLLLYRRMIEQLASLPHWPKLIALETGMGQAREVAQLLTDAIEGIRIEIITDYAGIERHVIAIHDNIKT